MFAHKSSSSDSKQDNNQMPLKPIKKYEDAKEFAGQIVAFQTASLKFGIGYGYKIKINASDVRFAIIRDSVTGYDTGEYGYGMSIFFNPTDMHSGSALTDKDLASASMLMRLASTEELNLIKIAITKKEAEIRYTYHSTDDIIKILDDSIKLGSKTRKLSR